MKITVMGAGAVGGYFGVRLAQGGHDVLFVARGTHLEALRKGLALETPGGSSTLTVRASDRPEAADLVLLCVKSYDTESAAAQLPPGSRVLSLQNGLGNVEKLKTRFQDVITGVAYVSAEVVAPGRIVLTAGGRIVIDRSGADLRPAFEASGIQCDVSDDIARDQWEKLLANSISNTFTVALGCELGDLLRPPHRAKVDAARAECVALARALGISLRPEALERPFRFMEKYPHFKSSTQQDRARGKPLEVEALVGEVVRRAHAAGVPVPTYEDLYRTLKALPGAR